MKSAIKRPIRVYVYHAAWIFMTLYYASRNTSTVGTLTLVVLAGFGTVSFISLLIKRNYFEIKNRTLLIHRDLFRSQSIKLVDISRIELEPGPFTHSKIYLKEGEPIKYSDQMAGDHEVRELFGQFNIPVE